MCVALKAAFPKPKVDALAGFSVSHMLMSSAPSPLRPAPRDNETTPADPNQRRLKIVP